MSKELDQIKTHIELNNLRLGHNPLIDEPLNDDDWGEAWRAYVAFQHQLRMVVLKARQRREGMTMRQLVISGLQLHPECEQCRQTLEALKSEHTNKVDKVMIGFAKEHLEKNHDTTIRMQEK